MKTRLCRLGEGLDAYFRPLRPHEPSASGSLWSAARGVDQVPAAAMPIAATASPQRVVGQRRPPACGADHNARAARRARSGAQARRRGFSHPASQDIHPAATHLRWPVQSRWTESHARPSAPLRAGPIPGTDGLEGACCWRSGCAGAYARATNARLHRSPNHQLRTGPLSAPKSRRCISGAKTAGKWAIRRIFWTSSPAYSRASRSTGC